jgi:hypothetical protein
MRIPAGVAAIEPDLLQQRTNPLRYFLPGCQPMNLDPFGDGRAHGHTRIE